MLIPAVVLVTALILMCGFFLPSYVSGFTDRQTIGKLDITGSGSISFETKSELGIIDRLKMVTDASSVSLDNGKNMDANTAYQNALTELGKISCGNAMVIDLPSCRLSKYDVAFFIDSSDPTKSLIVWGLFIQDGTHDIIVSVDDETGKLLSLQYSLDLTANKKEAQPAMKPNVIRSDIDRQDGITSLDTELIGQAFAAYYGLTLVRTEIPKNDKYTRLLVELSDGTDSMTLIIAITYKGFSVNI